MSDTFAMARARKALEEAGLDYRMPLERASSVTNEVWLSPEFVIRVNRQPNQRLHREAMLGPLLPPDVNYPEIVAYGGTLGADWLIVTRHRGNVLSRLWPGMPIEERREATRQLAAIMRRLHTIEAPDDLPDIAVPQLLDGRRLSAVDPLLEAIDRARPLPHVDGGFLDRLRAMAEDLAPAIEPFGVQTLVHGDLHFENVLWETDRITALLDFEYARPGPPDLDLDVLLRFCCYPFLHVAEDYEHLTRAEDYEPIPYWLAEDYPELFAHPQVFERTLLYSIAYGMRELLEMPPTRPPRELSRYHPYNRLDLIVQGRSHLHRLAGRAGTAGLELTGIDDPFDPGFDDQGFSLNPGLDPRYVGDTSPPLGRAGSALPSRTRSSSGSASSGDERGPTPST